MAKEHIDPRQTLAINLKGLLAFHEMTAPELASRAGIDRKTVNNQLNGRFDPRLQQVNAVAKVFRITVWQLLSPQLDPSRIDSSLKDIMEIYEHYRNSDALGREAILRVAQATAKNKHE